MLLISLEVFKQCRFQTTQKKTEEHKGKEMRTDKKKGEETYGGHEMRIELTRREHRRGEVFNLP